MGSKGESEGKGFALGVGRRGNGLECFELCMSRFIYSWYFELGRSKTVLQMGYIFQAHRVQMRL